jgi:peptidoglycan glycosyltransferase
VDYPFNLARALANSCNYFFSEVSTRLPSSVLAHWFVVFGFGSTDAQDRDSSPGQVHVEEEAREKALAALGEQGVTATPAQVLLAYSAIATQGKMFRLTKPGQTQPPTLARTVPLQKSTFDVLNEGLEECVESAMCQAAAVEGVRVVGKTGSARALDGSGATHAWFVGYAPAASPEVALVVFLNRGTGAGAAAPLAGRILQEYFARKSHNP